MKVSKIVKLSHELLLLLVTPSDIIIDATLGNGYDSLFLSNFVSHIYGFDIQELALENSRKTLHNISNVTMILDSHLNYSIHVNNYDGVIFNLGYLPTSDKTITTTSKVTIATINKMIKDNVAKFILLVVYPGHLEGMDESIKINEYLESITTYNIQKFKLDDDPKKAYILLLIKNRNY